MNCLISLPAPYLEGADFKSEIVFLNISNPNLDVLGQKALTL